MAPKLLFVSLLLLLLLSTTLALAYEREDPELKQCKQECELQPQPALQLQCERRCEEQQREKEQRGRGGDDNQRELEEQLERCRRQCREQGAGWKEQQQCQRRCEETYKEKKQQQEERGRNEKDPEERLRECIQACRQEERSRRSQCEQHCEADYRREREKEEGHGINPEREEEEEQQKRHYIFGKESFVQRFRTEHGNVRYLKKFYELSDLLTGIGNYRIAVLTLNPKSFVVPHHCDTEALLYVVRGRGGLSMVCSEGRVSHEVREGDILWVPAGAVVYMVNKNDNEPLVITKLLQPVAVPGDVQEYFPVGGDNVESYFSNFSDEVLEAAFNVPKERLERIFGRKGPIIRRASDEQVREIGSSSSEGGGRGWRGSKRPFNLLRKQPSHSTGRGQIYEATGDDYQPLKELNIRVSFANITRGSMLGPFFNSLATKIAVIVDGAGRVEMACPHIPSRRQRERGREGEQEEQQGQRYHRVSSEVAPGHVIVIPPGHPAVEIASEDKNLQALCFEIRAYGNERNFLAGKNNVWQHMEDAAKELTFGASKREVDQLLGAQKEEKIVQGPRERGRRQPLSSIMDFLGF